MKTKKQSVQISSILGELILQSRTSPFQQTNKNLSTIKDKLSHMHRNHHYPKQLYSEIVDKPQYNIEQKLTLKENRLNKYNTVCIHFKLTEKRSSHMTYIESWLVSIVRHHLRVDINKFDTYQELAYLLQDVIRGLNCQFLADFSTMGQQFKSRYILDYEIEINPSKKNLKKLSPLHYQKMWKKQAFLDQRNKITVACYHNTNKKLLSIITQERQWSRQKPSKLIVKHGSEQTKPSNSGEYELSTSIEEKAPQRERGRKTSMYEFYDEDLNMTVLSNDSESFKKSTGRIQGVYTTGAEQNNKNQAQYDSDEQFQLLIQQEALEQVNRLSRKKQQETRIREIQRGIQQMFHQFDQTMEGYLI